MKRKLIKQAGQAITITLPIEWIRDNGLKAGEEIELEFNEKDLILKSKKKVIGNSIKLDISEFPFRAKYVYINAAYASGVDEINLESDKGYYPNLNQDIGFVIISQEGNNYVIRDVGGLDYQNLDEIFKRAFQMIINFYDSAIENMFSQSKEKYETIQNKDGEINKFILFLQRAIIKMNYSKSADGKIMFAYSFALEKIGDEILRIWRTDINSSVVKDKKIREIIDLSREGLRKAFEIYYQSDPKKVFELLKMREDIRKKSDNCLAINSDTSNFIIHANRILEDAYDITHLALMKKFAKS
nr:hypothetical protein [Nanoarchaeum sp.]